ncbi:MAG: SET domain-containing protein-lysine N-methyltransferase [Candidatus Omnitrophica bacterium]|nr:SET domain-containing protein-lysine N-methyltransferase [Candidatus Omnitrophota bacterium]
MVRFSFLSDKVMIKKSHLHRKGIFAKKKIKKGEVIAVWGGYVITHKEFKRLSRYKFKNIVHYATKIADGFYIISSKNGRLEDDDFFNHSCSPNTGIKGQVMMVAMRNINAGEEITYDYAMTDAGFPYSFECKCGSPECRGRVTSDDWKDRRLQKKYKGYFSWYIQEKIDAIQKFK